MACPATPVRTSSVLPEMLLVSPATPFMAAPGSHRKRKCTPSRELSSAKRLAIVTTPGGFQCTGNTIQRKDFSSPMGWPDFIPEVQIDGKVALAGETLSDDPDALPSQNPRCGNAKHIILPFDLRRTPSAYYSEESTKLLKSLFPSNQGIGTDGVFLYYYFPAGDMPCKPWPKTVGGLPVYFATVDSIGRGQVIGLSPKILGDSANPRNRPIPMEGTFRMVGDWTPVFDTIRAYFEKLEIPMNEVIYWGNYVNVVLETREVDLARLPPKVADLKIFYFYEDQMGRPSGYQTRRVFGPTSGNPDNTKIIHPTITSGRVIGEVVKVLGYTGIALVKLNEKENFQNITFENDDTPITMPLTRLVTTEELRIGDGLLLDSPDTGAVAGVFMGACRARVPTDDPDEPEKKWIMGQWHYMGQGSALELPDGMCGSIIFSEKGEVVGFFRYAPKSGVLTDHCMSAAAEELIDRGYTLVDQGNNTA